MYRKYYSYNDMPTLQKPAAPTEKVTEHPPAPPPHGGELCTAPDNSEIQKNDCCRDGIIQNGKILGNFELDDLLLLFVILILVLDDCDDKLLLLALGFIFLSGADGKSI